MKKYIVRFAPLFSFGVMAAIGWLSSDAGKINQQTTDASIRKTSRTSSSAKQIREPGIYRVPPYATEHVNAIRAAGDAAAQMRATLALVNSLPLAELHNWMEGRWFDDREGFNLTLFNHVAKERWMREDPSGYCEWALKNSNSDPYSAARLWVQKDPDAALSFLKKNPKAGVLSSVLYELAKIDPQKTITEINQLITDGKMQEFQHYYGSKNILSQIPNLTDPSFQEMIQKWPVKFQNEVAAILIEREFKSNITNAIAQLSAKPELASLINWNDVGDSDVLLENFSSLPLHVKRKIMDAPYNLVNRENAEKWMTADLTAMGLTEDQKRNLIYNSYFHLPPEKAISVLHQLEPGSSQYINIRDNILSRVSHDVDKLKQFQQEMTDPEDQQMITKMIDAAEAREAEKLEAQESPNQPQPSLVQKFLDEKDGNYYNLTNVLRNLNKQQQEDFSKQYATLSKEQQNELVTRYLKDHNLRYLPESIAAQFFETALDSDPKETNHQLVEASSEMVRRKLMTSPDEAREWINQLPEGQAKEYSKINLAYNWALFDFNAAQQWAQTLPEASRKKLEIELKSNGIDLSTK